MLRGTMVRSCQLARTCFPPAKGTFIQSISLAQRYPQTYPSFSSLGLNSARFLFSSEFLGTDNYQEMRAKSKQQFANMREKFLERMDQYMIDDTQGMVFTEDLKNVLFLIENKDSEKLLLKQMIARFNSQNQSLRFGSFVFGPVVLRTLHYFDDPDFASELFNDPANKGFFDQLSSYVVLGDLLYEKGQYDAVLQLLPKFHEAQFSDTKYPADLMLLTVAACYKIGTREAYETALKFLSSAREVEARISTKTAAIFASLALRMGEPAVAMEMLSITGSSYITAKNLRIMTLADLGRPEDALNFLRNHLSMDHAHKPVGVICAEAIESLTAAIEKRNDQLLTQEFHSVCRALKEGNHISDQTLDSILTSPVSGRSGIKRSSDPFDFQSRVNDSAKFTRQRARNMAARTDSTGWEPRGEGGRRSENHGGYQEGAESRRPPRQIRNSQRGDRYSSEYADDQEEGDRRRPPPRRPYNQNFGGESAGGRREYQSRINDNYDSN